MNIAITGASGLIGRMLVAHAASHGARLYPLVRRQAQLGTLEISWDPHLGVLAAADLEGMDAVVHLAGENLGSGRWTAARKARFRASRLQSTTLLCRALSQLRRPPEVLVVASAVGYYGDRGDVEVNEDTGPGRGFLAELVQAWEAAAGPARDMGIRVVHARFGIVLSRHGGALARQLPLFRWGLGGPLGSGHQYVSWIAATDAIGAVWQALHDATLNGPCNIVSPQPVTSAEFAGTLGRVLRRPVWLPAPAFALRLLLGDMADEALLVSTRVRPGCLLSAGYPFVCPELEAALRHELNR